METTDNGWGTKEIVTVKDIIGNGFDDEFEDFDMTEIQELVSELQSNQLPDLASSEYMMQRSLRCADLIGEYLCKLVKLVSYYEALANKTKYAVALAYEDPKGGKTTQEAKKWAGESSVELLEIEIKIAKIKGAKAVLEKKFEIVIRMFHSIKDMASGMRKSLSMGM